MKRQLLSSRQSVRGMLVSVLLALTSMVSAFGGSYTLNFINTNWEHNGPITKETLLDQWIEEDGHQYIKRIFEIAHVNFNDSWDDMIMFGGTNYEDRGIINFELSEAGRVIPTKIVVNMRKHNTDPSILCDFNLKLYDSYFENGITQRVYQTTPTEFVFEGSTMPFFGDEPIDNIIITTNFAVRLYSITVYFDDAESPATPEISLAADPEVAVEAGTTIAVGCPGAKSIAITDYTLSGHPLAPTEVEGEATQYTIDLNHRRFDVVATLADDSKIERSAFFAVKDAEYVPTLAFGNNPESAGTRLHAVAQGVFERLEDEEDGTHVFRLESTGTLEGQFTVNLAGEAHGGDLHEALTNDDFHAHQIDPDDPANCTDDTHQPYVLITEDENPMSLVTMSHPSAVPFSTHPNVYHGVTKAFNDATVQLRLKPFESAELTVVTHGVKTSVNAILNDRDSDRFEAYSLDGQRLKATSADELTPGLYIVRHGESTTKVIIR